MSDLSHDVDAVGNRAAMHRGGAEARDGDAAYQPLVERAQQLPKGLRLLFSASCAERSADVVRRLDPTVQPLVERALAAAWGIPFGDVTPEQAEEVEGLFAEHPSIASDKEPEDVQLQFVGDGMAVCYYTLQTVSQPDSVDPVKWAAGRAWDLASALDDLLEWDYWGKRELKRQSEVLDLLSADRVLTEMAFDAHVLQHVDVEMGEVLAEMIARHLPEQG